MIAVEVYKELVRRKEKNKRYSLRAYAKQLSVEPSLLSKIMREKITPTSKTVSKLIASLSLDAQKKTELLALYKFEKESNVQKYQQGKSSFMKVKSGDVAAFGSWDELVVFSTLGLKEKNTIEDLSCRLDIPAEELKNILILLQQKGLIYKDGIQYCLQVKQVADEIPVNSNQVKKDIQKKFLTEAVKKIDEINIEDRLNGTLTFTVDRTLLPKVKQKIASFMAELNGMSTSKSTQVTEVYNLTLALYPLRKDFV